MYIQRSFITKIVFFVVAVLLLSKPLSISAQSISFIANVVDTEIQFVGFTSPNSIVTFKENLQVIGTIVSDNLGYYLKNFGAITPGIHNISVFSTDPSNNNSLEVEKSILAIPFQTASISLDLSPTINILNNIQNNQIIISGYGKPNESINVFLKRNLQIQSTYPVTTNSNGYYTYTLNTGTISSGYYQISSILPNLVFATESQSISLNINIQSNQVIESSNQSADSANGDVGNSNMSKQEFISGSIGEVFGDYNKTLDNSGGKYLYESFLIMFLYLCILLIGGLIVSFKRKRW